MMPPTRRLLWLVLVVLTLTHICFATNANPATQDVLVQAPQASEGRQRVATDGEAGGAHNVVREARTILHRISKPKRSSLVHISKRKGFFGTGLKYAEQAFRLLFLNSPTYQDLGITKPARVSSPAPGSDLARAVKLLRSAVDHDQDPDALWLLAEMNFHGNFTHPRNYSAAFNYYHQLAALSGNASAQHMLGFMYATGVGGAVERDQARALLYHTFAADQGDIRSQMTIAYRHHAGIATPRNCDLAVKYYAQVAKKALTFYKSGPPGGHVLFKSAYRIADEQGGYYGEGASVISSGVNARQGGVTSDAFADIADVVEYLDFQSRKGDLRSMFNLAKLYYDGARGIERDLPQAKQLFMQIARMFWQTDGKEISGASPQVEKLAPRAAGFLGRMFLRGEGTKVSYPKALIWLKRGVEHGDVLSLYSMGVMYMQGLGVPRDANRAASYLSTAADSEMAVAQTDLGVLFLDQGDVNSAKAYFDHSVKSGHIEAFYYLGDMARQGIARDKSCPIAASYFKVASEKAEVLHTPWIEANDAFENGRMHEAVVGYMMAAEQGYESAQSNVAWLLDQTSRLSTIRTIVSRLLHFVPQSPISPGDAALSLIYYARSAKQNNIDSMVKAGDLHLLGLGVPPNATAQGPDDDVEGDDAATSSTVSRPQRSPAALLTPSPANAVSCYQAASQTMRSAQALWNLGWMHESGLGVEKDYHLAKRYYDLALETNKEAYLPVTLALSKLRLKSWWNDISHGNVRSISTEDADTDLPPTAKKQGWTGWRDWVGRFLEADRQMNGEYDHHGITDDDMLGDEAITGAGGANVRDDDDWNAQDRHAHRQRDGDGAGGVPADWPDGYMSADGTVYNDSEDDEGLFESLGILLLAGLLAGLIYWRQRRAARQAEEQRARAAAALLGDAVVVGQQIVPPPGGLAAADGPPPVVGEAPADPLEPLAPPPPAEPDGRAPQAGDGFVAWDAPGGVGH